MDDKKDHSNQPDYYIENGLVVFTEAFHLKRGYCCKRGCRHCPYPKSSPNPSESSKRNEDEMSND